MLNKVILIGRLARDPELRYTPSGKPVARFALAVERPYTNQMGEREVDFINIVAWQRLAEVCANNLGKGRLVAVDGRLQVRSYEGQDGQRRWMTEVVANDVRFLDWPRQGQAAGSEGLGTTDLGDLGDEIDFNEDDLPF
ncbi:MAG TPA: single-stranded DNA-binding protein [Firmicutes bacterium]|nr:single-stranded DNA-binding protein [Bacillota bacterium]